MDTATELLGMVACSGSDCTLDVGCGADGAGDDNGVAGAVLGVAVPGSGSTVEARDSGVDGAEVGVVLRGLCSDDRAVDGLGLIDGVLT